MSWHNCLFRECQKRSDKSNGYKYEIGIGVPLASFNCFSHRNSKQKRTHNFHIEYMHKTMSKILFLSHRIISTTDNVPLWWKTLMSFLCRHFSLWFLFQGSALIFFSHKFFTVFPCLIIWVFFLQLQQFEGGFHKRFLSFIFCTCCCSCVLIYAFIDVQQSLNFLKAIFKYEELLLLADVTNFHAKLGKGDQLHTSVAGYDQRTWTRRKDRNDKSNKSWTPFYEPHLNYSKQVDAYFSFI